MKYYVVSDVHGFYDELVTSLDKNGFFTDDEPHKLIICGDLFDRGVQALELQNFILDLIEKDKVILIRGNHEDLMLQLLNEWQEYSYLHYYHHTNGTINTILQLTKMTQYDLNHNSKNIVRKLLQSPYIKTIIPAMRDYFETSHYVFVHGWIPCNVINLTPNKSQYNYINNWRNADEQEWNKARWLNGMEAAHEGIIEPNKTIICGHWHSSFGHAHYENKGGEFNLNPDFSPYYATGIIALDACTIVSRKVNCIIIYD